MKDQHIRHDELVAAANGELAGARATEVHNHLAVCWTCRTEMKGIEEAIAEFVRAHQGTAEIPPAEAPRAVLRARLSELAALPPAENWRDKMADFFLTGNRFAYVAGSMAALVAVLFVVGVVQVSRQQFRLAPDPAITPGVAATISEEEVCQAPANEPRMIPASVGRQVFDRYGIDRPKPRDYELDYLISPELGGADDPGNYWPQPYAVSPWNAHVKDALEDHLRQLVCEKKVSLQTAQRDIASDWIAAYKKYFQTENPIASHREFTKDRPWEP